MALDWGTVPAWLTAGIALLGTILALRQFQLSTRAKNDQVQAQNDQVQIARANLLLAIDKVFEGEEIYRSRKAVRSLRNRAEVVADRSNLQNKSPQGKKQAIANEVSHQLDKLWALAKSFDDVDVEDPKSADRIAIDRYSELMALANWIETVGMLCKRNLLPTDDILDLYDQIIIPTMLNFKNHLEARQTEGPYQNRRFMENAFWLYAKAVAYNGMRDQPVDVDPGKTSTRWN